MAAEKPMEAGNTDTGKATGGKQQPPRKIPGNLPYLTASGTLKRALERMIDASRPDKFNADFLENVLKLTGGAARNHSDYEKDGVLVERWNPDRSVRKISH